MSHPFGTHPMPAGAGQITESDRLKLLGLAVLAEQHSEMLASIHEAVAAILGEPWGDHGEDAAYSSDFVFGGDRFRKSPDELWRLTANVREGGRAPKKDAP